MELKKKFRLVTRKKAVIIAETYKSGLKKSWRWVHHFRRTELVLDHSRGYFHSLTRYPFPCENNINDLHWCLLPRLKLRKHKTKQFSTDASFNLMSKPWLKFKKTQKIVFKHFFRIEIPIIEKKEIFKYHTEINLTLHRENDLKRQISELNKTSKK